MSEGETHLSSRRAAASHSAQPRRAEAHAGAYAEERQASHHTAGGELLRPRPIGTKTACQHASGREAVSAASCVLQGMLCCVSSCHFCAAYLPGI